MSFLGKLLVGLQFALSIVFLAFAGAVFTAQQNWMTQKLTVDKNFQDLTREKDQHVEEAKQFQGRITQDLKNEQNKAQIAEGQAKLLKDQLEASEKELVAAKTERDEQRSLAKLAIGDVLPFPAGKR